MSVSHMPRMKQSGFTLTEMIFVIAIMAIIAGIAIPSFISLLPGMRLKDSVRSVFVATNLTRSEAVKRNAVGDHQIRPCQQYLYGMAGRWTGGKQLGPRRKRYTDKKRRNGDGRLHLQHHDSVSYIRIQRQGVAGNHPGQTMILP